MVQQPKPKLVQTGDREYDEKEEWIEAGFFGSWAFNDRENHSMPSDEEYKQARNAYEAGK